MGDRLLSCDFRGNGGIAVCEDENFDRFIEA